MTAVHDALAFVDFPELKLLNDLVDQACSTVAHVPGPNELRAIGAVAALLAETMLEESMKLSELGVHDRFANFADFRALDGAMLDVESAAVAIAAIAQSMRRGLPQDVELDQAKNAGLWLTRMMNSAVSAARDAAGERPSSIAAGKEEHDAHAHS